MEEVAIVLGNGEEGAEVVVYATFLDQMAAWEDIMMLEEEVVVLCYFADILNPCLVSLEGQKACLESLCGTSSHMKKL